MTGMAAARIGPARARPRAAGYFADLTVFDPDTVKDESILSPSRTAIPPEIPYVVVNGSVVVDDNRMRARAPAAC
jgi:N-acyl-D-amino-acid deacylase